MFSTSCLHFSILAINCICATTFLRGVKESNGRTLVFGTLSGAGKEGSTREKPLQRIGEYLNKKVSPFARNMLLKMFPSLKVLNGKADRTAKISSGRERVQRAVTSSHGISTATNCELDLIRMSREMFGEDIERLSDHTLGDGENPTAKATLMYIRRDDYAFNFIQMVFGIMRSIKKGHLNLKQAADRIADYFDEKVPSPTRDLLIRRFPILKGLLSLFHR
ncbi:hypothetical protein V3C99_015915 [Haemonchus contortus]